jgi:3-oxoacyl-[acyl-carrier-protein] synthase-3
VLNSLRNISLKAISVALPEYIQDVRRLPFDWSEVERERVIRTTGISKMPVLAPHQTLLDLAVEAARQLTQLQVVGTDRLDADAIIFITPSPDYLNPGNSTLLLQRLGCSIEGPHFDLTYGCSGLGYGLLQASMLIQSLAFRRILLIIGESGSRAAGREDRSTRVLFGDAAAAIWIESAEQDPQYLDLGLRPSAANSLLHLGSGTRPLPTRYSHPHLTMNGLELMRFVSENVPSSIERVLQRAQLTIEDLSFVSFHQASRIVVDFLKAKLKLDEAQTHLSLASFGNTGNASQLVNIVEHVMTAAAHESSSSQDPVKNTRIWSSKHVLLCGFGAGLSWSTSLLKVDECKIHPFTYLHRESGNDAQ